MLVSAALGALALLVASPALAQHRGPGLRAGASADPDQFYIGAHWISTPLVEQFRFQPNLEVGIGSDLTLVAVNLEFAYWVPLPNRDWNVYIGGGPALNTYMFDEDRFGDRDTELEGGVNLLVGLAHDQGLLFEFKVGLIDSPEVKVGVGFTF